MDKNSKETRQKILEAAVTLMKDHGFKGVTTRAIASQAGVNEVTVFRHFGNKRSILEAIIEDFSLDDAFIQNIQRQLTWDIEKDLYVFSQAYQQFVSQNKEVIMIVLKEMGSFPGLEQKWAEIPNMLKNVLLQYFQTMREKGEIIETNLEAQALALLWMNAGFFMSYSLLGNHVASINQEEFLKNSIQTFARGLKQ